MPRVNFSGRKRIFQRDVNIRLKSIKQSELMPEVEIDFSHYDFPSDATISIEFSNREVFEQRSFGTVGNPGFKRPSNIKDVGKEVLLYACVKVNSPDTSKGRILGMMRKVRVYGDGGEGQQRVGESFVPVIYGDLGEEVWRLDIPEDQNERPLLVVNKALTGSEALASHPTFRALVMPVVLRRILERYVLDYKEFSPSGDPSTRSEILSFAIRLAGESNLQEHDPESESFVDHASVWIDEVVRQFCAQHEFSKSFNKGFSEGAQT